MRRLCPLVTVLAAVGTAAGQQPDPAQPRVTKELGKAITDGMGKLTEAEVIKLLPCGYKVFPAGKAVADWKITCDEVTEFEVEFIDGKVYSASATFSPAAKTKRLTLENYRKLEEGVSKEDVEKLLGPPNSTRQTTDSYKRKVTTCGWQQGHGVMVFVTGGKVSGGGFWESVEK